MILRVPFLPAAGMALFPFILVKTQRLKLNKVIINHENIHLRQQLELLVIPFYALYFLNYLLNLLYYMHHDKAYRNIVFEREAYSNERNPEYLKHRTFWSWTSFFAARYQSA
ncbi:hypothetical protein GZH53_12925 [Flavihumibacter sp. R14]|nr:hypothetical protein [Flavihumibacter soli]